MCGNISVSEDSKDWYKRVDLWSRISPCVMTTLAVVNGFNVQRERKKSEKKFLEKI